MAGVEFSNGDQPGNSEGKIVMKPWLPDPRVLNGFTRSGIGFAPEDIKPHLPLWRLELRKQLQEKSTSDGKPDPQESGLLYRQSAGQRRA
jgi:hypothetical protein